MTNVIIAGVGGQGTVLMSRLIGSAGISAGLSVRGTETIGMAQRGGSVLSHVRMGSEIFSPLIPLGKADLVIALESGEAVRALPYLWEGGALVTLDRAVKPVTSSLGKDGYEAAPMIECLKRSVEKLIVVDGGELMTRCGTARTSNVALLGVAAAAGFLPFGLGEVAAAVRERVPAKYLEMNETALSVGAEIARENGRG